MVARPGAVERLEQGMPGYRMRLPEKVHPISAGVKGGLLGGLVMPLPALVYSLSSGHGIWYPLNLLAGTALPGVGRLSEAQLEQFHLSLFSWGPLRTLECRPSWDCCTVSCCRRCRRFRNPLPGAAP